MSRIIEVSSAVELDGKQTARIEKVFSSKHKGEKIDFVYKIDKELIGGILVVDGDKYYDGTMRSQIDKIADSFQVNEKYLEAATPAKRRKAKKSDGAVLPAEIADQIDKSVVEKISSDTFNELSAKVDGYKKTFDVRHAGSVEFCGDGVIMCSGLADAEYGEMLRIENGAQAIVLSLSDEAVGAIVLDDDDKVSAHMLVNTTGMIVSVPVGDKLLGRVVNPLGKPIDGLGDFTADKYRPIEASAPAIKDRDKVDEPLQTGLLAID